MGTNNLVTKTNGEVINATDPNQYKQALTLDVVPRNVSGIPENEAGSLGTDSYEWEAVYTRNIQLDGTIAHRGTATTKDYTASDSWEAPSGVYRAFVIAAGAGGDATAGIAQDPGAGGGGVATGWVDVTPGTSYTITIGSGIANFASLLIGNKGGDGVSSGPGEGGSYSIAASVIGGIGGYGGGGEGTDTGLVNPGAYAGNGFGGRGGESDSNSGGGGGGFRNGGSSAATYGNGGGGFTAASGSTPGVAGVRVQYYLPSGVTDPN